MPDQYLVGNGAWASSEPRGTGPNPLRREEQAEALRVAALDPETVARFNTKYIAEPMSGCWLWIGARTQAGYGRLARNHKFFLAHRISRQISCGDVRPGHLVCHSCDTPSCVNPEHLWVGTPEENTRDCMSKGRLKPGRLLGEDASSSKLTDVTVLEIVKLHSEGTSCPDLARAFGVSRNTIGRVLNGETWSQVSGIRRRIAFSAEAIVAATLPTKRKAREYA